MGTGHLARYDFEGTAIGPMLMRAHQYRYPLSEWRFTWDDKSGLVRLRFVPGTEPGERIRPDTEHHLAVGMRGRAS